jgi:DNA-directed RNA polymerase subunit L
MVVAINVKKTIEDAFIFYLERENNHSLIKSLVHGLSALEAISALSEYFSYPIYQNFQDIITIYINEGGDILTLTTYLLDDIHRANSHLQKVIKLSLRKSIEVLILWILCFLAAIMMRFSIKDIYEAIISNYYISLGLVTLYGLLIMTFYFGCRLFKSEITIKEQV